MNTPDAATLARWCALAAKLEGWRWVKLTPIGFERIGKGEADRNCRWFVPADFYNGDGYENATLEPGNYEIVWGGCGGIPPYDTDLNAVARLEALVRERGRETQRAYLRALVLICAAGYVPGNAFDCYTATAAQRLEAVLVACGIIGEGE